MADLLRPPPPDPWPTRVRRACRAALDRIAGTARLARVAVGVGVVLCALSVGWWLVRPAAAPVEAGLPRAAPEPTRPGRSTTPAAPGASTPAPAGSAPTDTVVVQAAGAVVAPGVYRLPAGSRVADLLAAAGGALPGVDPQQLALASRLADGQRVDVLRPGEAPPATATAPPAGPLDLNTASADALDGLQGIGPATARAIVAYRERNGPFRSVDGLLDVPGIGPAKLEAFRDLVTVSP